MPQEYLNAPGNMAGLPGQDLPEGVSRRTKIIVAAMAALAVFGAFFTLRLLPQRAPVRIDIAAGGGDGSYLRMVQRYNEHLRPLGVELVPNDYAKSAFSNIRLLADGTVKAAFVKGGFAGALRDPDHQNEEQARGRAAEWNEDWTSKIKNFVSLGRLALEPLWVFTFGAAESNQLAELDGEPISLGSRESGGRALSALLLEKNGVRSSSRMWMDIEPPTPKPGDAKPLGLARALFLQRSAESPYVQALLANLATEKQFDKTGNIKTAAFSPRGRRIAVALGDQTVRILDAFSGQELVALKGHTDEINDVAFNADGSRVATGSDDDTIRIWDSRTGAQIGSTISGSGNDINSVAFSPDGTLIVSASDSDRATIRNIATGQVVLYLEGKDDAPGHIDDVNSAQFSPDGGRVVTASRDGTARIWDATSGAPLAVMQGHTKPVSSAVFSPDGRLVATSSWDNTARLWDAASGRIKAIMTGHDDLVRAVEFSPDGRLLITASWDDSARIWEVATGREIRKINGIRSNVNGVGFSPDGKVVMTASQDSTVRIWDVATWEKVADFHATTAPDDAHGSGRALHLMDFSKDAEAYTIRFPFLSAVKLPRGAIRFEPHVPPEPVTLLATTVAFVVDKTWAEKNPSLVRVLADAIVHKPQPGIDEVSGRQRLFHSSGQFPTLSEPEFEVSPLAGTIYRTGELPFVLSRLAKISVLPFSWAAWFDEHAGTLVFSLIPLLGVVIPLIRFIPALYNWTIRRRILYWYRRLHVLESRLDQEERAAHPELRVPEIDRIDTAVAKIRVPLSYSDQYYDLRSHIDLVRQRLAARMRPNADKDPPAPPLATGGKG